MDEVQKLILEVVGRDKVDALSAALRDEQNALAKLAADMRTGAIAQGQFSALPSIMPGSF